MINRVLIRIKVVQMLYSHLLIENRFMLESQPVAPTKEKRFAYSLYLDMMLFMIKVSEQIKKRGGEKPLAETRFIKRLREDDVLKSATMRYSSEPYPLQPAIDTVAERLKTSSVYKNFIKLREKEHQPDATVWGEIFNSIIMQDEVLNSLLRKRENYTIRGVERFRDMVESTIKKFLCSQDNVAEARRQLIRSLDKSHELYMRLLMLPVELTQLRELQIDEARHKYLQTNEDRFPNLRFVENELVKRLIENDELEEYVSKHPFSWIGESRVMMEGLLRRIMESEIYKEYMSFPATDLEMDVNFWRDIFRKVILTDEDFLEELETKSVFWNDDLDVISDFVIKTFRRFAAPEIKNALLPQYKDEEDARFGSDLFTAAVKNRERYTELINTVVHAEKWDSERLAFMDVVIMIAALAEIMNFPSIPLNVSINEYIEIAKYYSTPKSAGFINGLLATIVKGLKENGELLK